jgi:replicative DNA helicase
MTTASGDERSSAADFAAQALLGALLWDSRRVRDVAGWLEAGDFYRPDHGAIYATLVGLLADGRWDVDVFTVLASLLRGDHHDLHVDRSGLGPLSAPGLHSLISMTPATPRAEEFRADFGAEARSEHLRDARIVQEDSIRRRVQALGARIGQYARQVGDRDSDEAGAIVAPVLAEARARLRELAGRLDRAGAGRMSIAAALNPAPSPAAPSGARSERRRASRQRTEGEVQVRRAEYQLIGACLVSAEVRRLVHGYLRGGGFTEPEVAATWEAIETLHGRGDPADFVLVAHQVERQGALPGVGRGLRPDQLYKLAARSHPVNGLAALETVVHAAFTRTLRQARDQLQSLAGDRTRSGADVLAGAGHIIDQATTTTTRRLTSTVGAATEAAASSGSEPQPQQPQPRPRVRTERERADRIAGRSAAPGASAGAAATAAAAFTAPRTVAPAVRRRSAEPVTPSTIAAALTPQLRRGR